MRGSALLVLGRVGTRVCLTLGVYRRRGWAARAFLTYTAECVEPDMPVDGGKISFRRDSRQLLTYTVEEGHHGGITSRAICALAVHRPDAST